VHSERDCRWVQQQCAAVPEWITKVAFSVECETKELTGNWIVVKLPQNLFRFNGRQFTTLLSKQLKADLESLFIESQKTDQPL
jgi:hypothetical protein